MPKPRVMNNSLVMDDLNWESQQEHDLSVATNYLQGIHVKMIDQQEENNKKIEELKNELDKVTQVIEQLAHNNVVKSKHSDVILQLKDVDKCITQQKLSILRSRQQIYDITNLEIDLNIEHQHVSREMYKEKQENEDLKRQIMSLEKQLYLEDDNLDDETSMATESFSLERIETIQEAAPALNVLRLSDADIFPDRASIDSFLRFEESHLRSMSQMRRNMSKQFDQAQDQLLKINKEISFVQESFHRIHTDLNQQIDEIKREIIDKHGDEQGEQIINIEYKNFDYMKEIIELQQQLQAKYQTLEQETSQLTSKQEELKKVSEVHNNIEKVKVQQLQQQLQKLQSDMVYISVIQTVEQLELQEINKQIETSKKTHIEQMNEIKREYDNEMIFLVEKKQQSEFLESTYKAKMQQQEEKQMYEINRIMSDFQKTTDQQKMKFLKQFQNLLIQSKNSVQELFSVTQLLEKLLKIQEENISQLESEVSKIMTDL